MKIIETDGIPPQIIAAMVAKMNTYRDDKRAYMDNHKVDHEYSVTTLAKSPRQHQLILRHWDEIEVKAIELYYVLIGSVVHSILETYPNPNDQVEYRYGRTYKVGDLRVHVHGMGDVINLMSDAFRQVDEGVIEDWKYASMSAMNYEKSDYIQQLNILRYLLGEDRHKIRTLRNNFLFRDWRLSDVKRGKSPQPKFCKVVDHPIWSDEECRETLKNRVIAHTSAIKIPDDDLPFCTDKELWTGKSGFRIRAKTQKGEWSKVTLGWTETEEQAKEVIALKQPKTEVRLEPTVGQPKKCAFCDARPFCNQYARMQKPTEDNEDEHVEL